ncbi:MAG: GtrA family protein [Gammaproteobacteria bacterium]
MSLARNAATKPVRMREVIAFGAVGATAFLVHFAIVMVTVPLGVAPLLANVFGFLAAFAVSFVGHGRWSFPAEGRPVAPALRRFVAVAVSGFVLNEIAYAVLLRATALDYRVALFIVLCGVAGLTWVAGRYWAFAHRS